MFLLIDNYDSFTFNLSHYMGELGVEVDVRRNDSLTPAECLALGPEGVVISPGPRDPDNAGVCLDLLAAAEEKRVPVFGVCLGHQSIGQHFGAKVVRAPSPMHGKVSAMTHDGSGVFAGLPSPFEATRYHSLTLDPDGMPNSLIVTATSGDGVIQGVRHAELPMYGVQFHPESIASEHGHAILKNFIDLTSTKAAA